MVDNGDLGIVLYLRGPNSADAPSYSDRKGLLRNAGLLGTGYTSMPVVVDTAHPYASAAAACSMFVVISGLGDEIVTVRCRQAYRPEPSPGAVADSHFAGPPLVYFDTLWILQKAATPVNSEFALDADGAFLIQTASDLLGDVLEFSAKTDSAGSSASVMIAAKVGS